MNLRVFSILLVAGFLAAAQSTPPPLSRPSRQEDALREISRLRPHVNRAHDRLPSVVLALQHAQACGLRFSAFQLVSFSFAEELTSRQRRRADMLSSYFTGYLG